MHHQPDPDPTLLIVSLATLAAGPLLLAGGSRRTGARAVTELVVMIAVALLVLVEVVPECAHVAGVLAPVAAAVGLALPVASERWLGHPATGRAAGWLAGGAVALHAMTDGLGLAGAGAHAHGHGDGLGLAIVLHHVPEGAALWWVLRRRGPILAVSGLAAVGAFTVLGFSLGESLLPWVGSTASATFQAFVAGLLLHVLVHQHERSGGLGAFAVTLLARRPLHRLFTHLVPDLRRLKPSTQERNEP